VELALYAIGDLHLSFGANKPMDIFGEEWHNHIERIKSGFSTLEEDDVCVLCGDNSWGMSLEDSLEDFIFISELPGKKIILKGNHDYWWSTFAKMKAFFNANDINNVEILFNNSFLYGSSAICGTRGWMFDNEEDLSQNEKIFAREAGRLRFSLTSASPDANEKICFFHYPPRFKETINREVIDIMDEFGVKKCYYGHIHGHGHRFAVNGEIEGINYELVSADFVNFIPKKVLD
jgi:predicted phosphohydrolase